MVDSNFGDGFRFFSSWSGGKDSCLALHRMVESGNTCVSLFTMTDEAGAHSRSHGLFPNVLEAQAQALDLPIVTASATWQDYEERFKASASAFREQGIEHGVFGDIDLEPHREWVERVCRESGLTAHEPLWQGNRRELVREFIQAGFKAVIVVVDTNRMPAAFLGREVGEELTNELEAIGVDACGENGEFHTFVHDGPLFRHSVDYGTSDIMHIGNHAVLPIVTGT